MNKIYSKTSVFRINGGVIYSDLEMFGLTKKKCTYARQLSDFQPQGKAP